MTTQVSESRIDHIAIEKHLLNEKQAAECMKQYQALVDRDGEASLGDVMVEMGFITPEQLKALRAEQRRRKCSIHGYEIIDLAGRGSVGAVYRARQIAMDRTVALKVLRAELSADPSVVERYVSEARAVAKLNHPHIVQGIDVGESGGHIYFAMEFLPGGTLQDRLEKDGPLDEDSAKIFLYQTVSALDHAGELSIIHCDIKPANLMIDEAGRLKLTDLGLARMGGELDDEECGENGEGGKRVVRGTPHYLSPEQITSPEDLDCRTDIFSLGATFYHLMSGVTPFDGQSNKELILSRLKKDPLPLHEVAPGVGKGISRLISKMMSREREKRPKNPKALMKELVKLGVDMKSAGDVVGAIKKERKVTRARESVKKRTEFRRKGGGNPLRENLSIMIAGMVFIALMLIVALISLLSG